MVGDGEAEGEADRGRDRPEHHRVPEDLEVVEIGVEDRVEVVPDCEPGANTWLVDGLRKLITTMLR